MGTFFVSYCLNQAPDCLFSRVIFEKEKQQQQQKLPFVRLQQLRQFTITYTHYQSRVSFVLSAERIKKEKKKERDPQLPLLAYE